MDAKREFQVVGVTSECRLRDGEDVEHPYWRRDGRSLAPGFYIVHWPSGATVGRFNEDALFEGPFRQRTDAEANLPRIMALDASEYAVDASRRSPEGPTQVVDDRPLLRYRRPT